jgi:DNA replicative helicase MCM subunit Mcm2 (Cdc46/Mcm family)
VLFSYLGVTAAVLANHALLGIDEIGMMPLEEQNQFLGLMEHGFFDFNKMGIRQRLNSEAGFIVSSNTISGNWKEPDSVSVDEIPLKGQLADRLDLVFISESLKVNLKATPLRTTCMYYHRNISTWIMCF